MATKKNYHYVLVFTNDGPVYVTSVNNAGRYSVWDKSKDPLPLPKYYAEDIVFGLNCNYHNAVLVTSPRKIDYQPYNYRDYECKFVEKPTGEAEVIE